MITDGRLIADAEVTLAETASFSCAGPRCVGYPTPPTTPARSPTTAGFAPATSPSDGDEPETIDIVGRTKDVIIRGGENISSAEVEAVLEAHDAVRHAVAVGYPDALMGERVAAFVVSDGPFEVETARTWFARRASPRTRRRSGSSSSTSCRCSTADRVALRRAIVPG